MNQQELVNALEQLESQGLPHEDILSGLILFFRRKAERSENENDWEKFTEIAERLEDIKLATVTEEVNDAIDELEEMIDDFDNPHFNEDTNAFHEEIQNEIQDEYPNLDNDAYFGRGYL